MPISFQDVVAPSSLGTFRFDLAPAHNAAYSLFALQLESELSGLGEWVAQTNRAMSEQLHQDHHLVMVGLHGIAMPRAAWPSFPAFVDHLADLPAEQMPDMLLDYYISHKRSEGDVDRKAVLASEQNYIDFLYECFSAKQIDEPLERRAYNYLTRPQEMQTLIVDHLRHMWQQYLQPEWQRVEPMLRASVDAFSQQDLAGMDPVEAIRWVSGNAQDATWWAKKMETHERIVFVPSAHVGPYVGHIQGNDKTLWVIFGARLPQGTGVDAPDLSRAEIVVRLGALADDDRLRIMRLIAERGEMKSPEIIAELGLSQSAASRHLKQLSATGFLSERRSSGAKAYQLNQTRFADTFEGLLGFLKA